MANGYTTTQTPQTQFQNPYQYQPPVPLAFQNPYQLQNPYQYQQFANPLAFQGSMTPGGVNPQDLASIIGPILRGVLPVLLAHTQEQSWWTGADRFGGQRTQPWTQMQTGGYLGSLYQQDLPQIVGSVIQSILPTVIAFCQAQQAQFSGTRFPAFA